MKSLGIIPARFASTRLPGKMLLEIGGKSMIRRVYEQCVKCAALDEVIVATDDKRIFDHINSFGGNVKMTSPDHPSGTDRIAEVAKAKSDFEIIINIQGDEPFIQPQQIETVIDVLKKNKNATIATGVKQIENHADIFNPNVVKCVFGKNGKALLFSRNPIPFLRNEEREKWSVEHFYKHIGMYGFRRETLLEVSKLKPSRLEKLESLEQLRWLENGYEIFVEELPFDSFGIDTEEDLKKAEEFLAA